MFPNARDSAWKTFLTGLAFLKERVSNFFFCVKQTAFSCGETFKTFLNSPHFLTVTIFLSVASVIFCNSAFSPANRSHGVLAIASVGEPAPMSIAEPVVEQNVSAKPVNFTEIKGQLRPGDTLSKSFKRCKIDDQIRIQVIRGFADLLNFNELRPGDRYSVVLDESGELVKCIYESDPLNIYTINRTPEGYQAEKLNIPLKCQTIKIAGTIQSSLFEAFSQHTEDPKLIYAFADIFASKIDFNTETRKGDRFNVVFEKYFKDGQFIGYGKILVARYERANNEVFEGFYYTSEKTPGSYFDADGNGLGASFIRSPVPVGRVSSKFSFRRKHPISGVVRPHLGVDLAAPTGTPIMASADGRVKFVGWNGGFGKQVVLDHGNGFQTYYGHLSKYTKGLKAGKRVKQKQIIGYVGATGVATGPHLDYRIRHNGVYKNPFALKFKPKSVLKDEELDRFQQTKVLLARLMDSLDDFKIMQVKNITITPDTTITFL